MTQIDFYILNGKAEGNRYTLACRLSEKAWRAGHRVYLHTNSRQESAHVDKLLWSFRENSFLPHGHIDEADKQLNPILIGEGSDCRDEHDVLINLGMLVPDFFSQFERVAELIDHDQEVKARGRERYRFYKDRGYTLETHDIRQ